MRIALICGSPKGRQSTSDFLLNKLGRKCNSFETKKIYFIGEVKDSTIDELFLYDTWVIALPNYYGSIPSHLMNTFERIEVRKKEISSKKITVYAIINCGFYYSTENQLEMEIIQNWCNKSEINWGYGLSIGGGGSLKIMNKIPIAHLLILPVLVNINRLSKNICNKKHRENKYVNIWLTCKLYIFIAERVWYAMARKNGLKGKHALD